MDVSKQKLIVENSLGKRIAEIFEKIFSQKPKRANAIVFLQGDKLDRCPKTLSLYKESFSDKIVISGNNIREDILKANDNYLLEIKKWFLDHGVKKENIIIEDKSLNTLEQAINVIKIAKEKKWEKLILVTSPYHLLRVYLTFIRQIKDQNWEGEIIMQSAYRDWRRITSGKKEPAEKRLLVELEKIKKYNLIRKF